MSATRRSSTLSMPEAKVNLENGSETREKNGIIAELKAKHSMEFGVKMLDWLESGMHYDCSCLIGFGDEAEIVMCHRLILAISSPALEKMLYKPTNLGNNLILLQDTTPEAFHAILRFLYAGETSRLEENLDLASKVFDFATTWGISPLDQIAATLCLKANLSAEQLLLLHNLFSKHSLVNEAAQIMKIICERGSEVLSSLEKANKGTVEEILKQKSFNIFSEKDFFDGLLKWGASQAEAIKNEVEKDRKIRAEINALLRYIRFKCFNPDDMAHLCKSPNVLSIEEKMKIFTTVQLHDAVPPTMKHFDLKSGWRGKYHQNVDVVTLKLKKRTESDLKNLQPSLTIEPEEETYLIAVEVKNLYDTKGVMRQLEIKLIKADQVLSVVRCGTTHKQLPYAKSGSSMVRMANPCLLQGGQEYMITVTDLVTQNALQDYCFQGKMFNTKLGFSVKCRGVGDIGALELADCLKDIVLVASPRV